MDRTISDDGKFLMKLFKEAGVIDDAIAAARHFMELRGESSGSFSCCRRFCFLVACRCFMRS
jgi:hypothetical protein